MRRDIEFKTEDGVTLRGWFYRGKGAKGPAPTVVMAHGFSGVKEMYLDDFAEFSRRRGYPRSSTITAIAAIATDLHAVISIRVNRSTDTATRSPMRRQWTRSMLSASASGDQAIRAGTCLSSARSTGASNASFHRCLWSPGSNPRAVSFVAITGRQRGRGSKRTARHGCGASPMPAFR